MVRQKRAKKGSYASDMKKIRKILKIPGIKTYGPKSYIKEAYKAKSHEKYSYTPKRVKAAISRKVKSGEIPKGRKEMAQKMSGVKSFPGIKKLSSSATQGEDYGQKGLFTQSIKGMPGKQYMSKAFDITLLNFGKD